jgi:hypothetical protein
MKVLINQQIRKGPLPFIKKKAPRNIEVYSDEERYLGMIHFDLADNLLKIEFTKELNIAFRQNGKNWIWSYEF